MTQSNWETAGEQPDTGQVSVTYGIYQLELGLAGRTVGQAREALAGSLNIDPRSAALVNGELVEEAEAILRPGDRLEFVRLAGQKGWKRPSRTRLSSIIRNYGTDS